MLERASLDRVFQALADPTRRAILERLGAGEAAVSELAQPLPMSLAAVVQHVQALEESGLVTTRKQGRSRHCRLAPHALAAAEGWINQRRREWEARFDRLGELLAEDQTPERKDQPT